MFRPSSLMLLNLSHIPDHVGLRGRLGAVLSVSVPIVAKDRLQLNGDGVDHALRVFQVLGRDTYGGYEACQQSGDDFTFWASREHGLDVPEDFVALSHGLCSPK